MIEEMIRSHAIGEKVRALRKKKKMGLVELGRHTGLSAALLSKIETGKLIPPLPTLLRIAMVFSVGLDHFFAEDEETQIVALGRPAHAGPGDLLTVANARLRATIHVLGDEEKELTSASVGSAILYVLRGRVRAAVGEDSWTIGEGDCVSFSLRLPHVFCGLDEGALGLFVTAT